jgi:hypothetical protein
MAKLTAEEKLQRALDRKEAKRLEKQRAFIERVELAKEATNALMDEKQLAIFNKRKEIFVSGDKTTLSEIEKSIFSQYYTWGKLSIAQINVVLRRVEEQKKLRFTKELFDDFDINVETKVNLKFISMEQVFDEPSFYGQSTSHIAIRLINDVNQHFKINTNSKKIINMFAEKENVWFKVSATVKWVSDNKQYVNLSSKGIKIEEFVR